MLPHSITIQGTAYTHTETTLEAEERPMRPHYIHLCGRIVQNWVAIFQNLPRFLFLLKLFLLVPLIF